MSVTPENVMMKLVLPNGRNVNYNMSLTHGFAGQGITQCHSSILNDLMLPVFSNSRTQNIAHFIIELDEYFRLKGVTDSLKLPIAMKAVTDNYSRQWFTAVYKGLSSYDQFKGP